MSRYIQGRAGHGILLFHDDDSSIIIIGDHRQNAFSPLLPLFPIFLSSFFPSKSLFKPLFSPDDDGDDGRWGGGARVRSSCFHGPVPLKALSHTTRYG